MSFALVLPQVAEAQMGPDSGCFGEISLEEGGRSASINIEESWQEHCPSISQAGSLAKYFTLVVPENQGPMRMSFSLRTSVFERLFMPRLFLREERANSAVLLAENSPGDLSTNEAHIGMLLLPGGTYTLEVTSLRPRDSHPFILSVSRTASKCHFVVDMTGEGPQEFFGEWIPECPRSITDEGAYAVSYHMELMNGQPLGISLDGDDGVDTYLVVSRPSEDGEIFMSDDDSGAGLNSRIVDFFPPGSYTVDATTVFAETEGSFRISFTPDGPESCRSTLLSELMTETGTLTAECPSLTERNKYAFFYILELEEEKTLYALLEGVGFDAYLKIIDSSGIVVGENDDHNGYYTGDVNATDAYLEKSLAPGRYIIELTSFDEETTGKFKVSFSTSPLVPPSGV